MEGIVLIEFLLISFLLVFGIFALFYPLTNSKTYTRLLSTRPHLIPALVTALMLIMATMNRVYHPAYSEKVYHPEVYGQKVYHPAGSNPFRSSGYYTIDHTPSYYTTNYHTDYYTGWGFFDPSSGYFLLLRWVVMIVSLYIAYKGYQWKKIWVSWLFVFIAILFNPIAQITFERETWRVFDVLCALAFLTAGFLIKQPDIPKKEKHLLKPT